MNQIVDRRSLVTATAAIPAVAVPTMVNDAADFSAIEAKISAHVVAREQSDAAFAELGRLQDANRLPLPRVQYGRLKQWNEDGTDRFEPLYAYSVEMVEARRNEQLRHLHSIWGRYSALPDMLAKANARYDALVDDLHKQQAARKAAEDACGITSAHEKANRLGGLTDDAMAAIRNHHFRSLTEFNLAVEHVTEVLADDGCDEDEISYEIGKIVTTAINSRKMSA